MAAARMGFVALDAELRSAGLRVTGNSWHDLGWA
jgi:hypothetical protein